VISSFHTFPAPISPRYLPPFPSPKAVSKSPKGRQAGRRARHPPPHSQSILQAQSPTGGQSREGPKGVLRELEAAVTSFPFPVSICHEINFPPFERE
jgi:hypothetical protein